ncbi:MAG TPA: IPT/TIG domain-containing protein [Bryobacteraceae bacterium]|nr:IPT/TIG domain-containing protein [Bryobacteraceae bacterium]
MISLTLSAALCRGQSVAIGLSSGAAAAGGSVTLNLSLNTASSLPAALEWTLAYSALDFGAATIAAGPAATGANKQLSCSNSAGSATCILWGLNDTTVSTGVLATVTLPINHTTDSSSQLQLTGNAAADPSGSTLATSATGGTVTIQPGMNGFTCTPVAFAAPATTSCTITLTSAAPVGGTTIALTASPASAMTLPASVTIPQGSPSGAFSVTAGVVTVSTSVMLTASDLGVNQGFGVTVNPPPAPQITSLSPTSATVGTPVTITGTNFGATQGASTVTFNGASATPSSWSATSIVAPVPAGATSGNVLVTVGGVGSNGANFTVVTIPAAPPPAVSSLNPAAGPAGTAVTITGTNFGTTQGVSTVTFDGTAATPTSWSATSIVVPVPAGAASGNVVVKVGGATSNGEAFTVLQAPQISSLSPASATVGTPVTITGTNFGATRGASTVTFNGVAATPSSWSATSIVVPVPAAATSGNVVVTVGGVASNGVAFAMLQTTVTLVGLSIKPSTLLGGQLAVGTLTLSAPASAVVTVALSASGHYGVVSVPVLVKIPIGATSAIFTILTQNVKKTTTFTVTATYGGAVLKASLSIQPAP